MTANVWPLGEVANFVTGYFPLKIKFLARRKREFTTKFAILPNGCYAFGFLRYFFTFQFSVSLPHRLSRKQFLNSIIMSEIKIEDCVPNYSEIIKNLEKLTVLLKDLVEVKDFLNANGFNLDFKFTGQKDYEKVG